MKWFYGEVRCPGLPKAAVFKPNIFILIMRLQRYEPCWFNREISLQGSYHDSSFWYSNAAVLRCFIRFFYEDFFLNFWPLFCLQLWKEYYGIFLSFWSFRLCFLVVFIWSFWSVFLRVIYLFIFLLFSFVFVLFFKYYLKV